MRVRSRLLAAFLGLTLQFCRSATVQQPTAPPAPAVAIERFRLHVSLYPWVPNAGDMVKRVERDFESAHPDVDLVVRSMDRSIEGSPEYIADLAYSIDDAKKALTSLETDADFQQLVEVDAVTLGALASHGVLAPFSLDDAHFVGAAQEAVTVGGRSLGVPHWTCGYFVISELKEVAASGTAGDLVARLKAAGTDRADLAGDLDGSWDSVLIYLDAIRDTRPDANLLEALRAAETSLDPTVLDQLSLLRTPCTSTGKNLCGADGAAAFARGDTDSIIGYSERLNDILKANPSLKASLRIAAAPLGAGDHPSLFVDALVLSTSCAKERRCLSAARAFAAYYVSDRTYETLLLSLDAPDGTPPRYLLPATTTAFTYGRVGEDPLYKQLLAETRDAKAFPNEGVPSARASGKIRAAVKTALGL